MSLQTLIPIIMDLALGGIAYRLARSLERTVTLQSAILVELTKRVDILEKKLP